MKTKIVKYIIRGLLLWILTFPLWYRLGEAPIHIWDEAIYANNAVDMSKSHNPVVLTNKGGNNLYNVKPPFVIILQSFCIKLFGISELSVRLPSLFASLGVCILLIIFSKRIVKKEIVGWIAILFLVTMPGFSRVHVARSGDLDAVLIFFITFYTLLSFDLIFNEIKNTQKHLFWIGIGVSLAFLSKSVAGLIPLVGIFLALILSDNLTRVLKSKYFYISSVFTISICCGYYFLREWLSPGYLDIVIFSEYRRFFENIMPYHEHPPYFYFKNWFDFFLIPHIYLIIPLFIYGCFISQYKKRNGLIMLFCVAYMLIISFPKVKLDWYDSPIYPTLSLFSAIALQEIYTLAANRIKILSQTTIILATLFIASAYPYYNIFIKINNGNELLDFEKEGAFLKQIINKHNLNENITILMKSRHIEHYDHARFYMKRYQKEGFNIQMKNNLSEISPENQILVCQKVMLDSIKVKYRFATIDSIEECKLIRILL